MMDASSDAERLRGIAAIEFACREFAPMKLETSCTTSRHAIARGLPAMHDATALTAAVRAGALLGLLR